MDNIFSKYTERYSVKKINKNKLTPENKEKTSDEDISFNNTDIYNTKSYDTSYKINGMTGYLCPNCYTVQHINTKVTNNAKITFDKITDDDVYDIESNKIELSVDYNILCRCPVCKYYKTHIKLDDNIADAIGILNIKGFYTSASSEGYKSQDGIIHPYIDFNRLTNEYSLTTLSKIENYIESTLPLSWYVDRPTYIMSYTYMDTSTLLSIRKRKFVPPYISNNFIIKADYCNKEEALYDILKWTRSLPDLQKEGII